jgi:phage head maturation protease
MKQLELTPELEARIKSAVGNDVDLTGIAVFEAITLNTKPLPGKRGTLWEGAVATPLTLRQIADHINGGGHIPLIADHDLFGAPKGRVFAAELMYGDDGEFELRTLFYLDQTETTVITKINAGSLDEVSISFLPTQYQCSECDFDYLGEGSNFENLYTRTCSEGHKIGVDGVHVRMIGLASLVEVSVVARGAADNPKIVGRSSSKVAPASAQRLAARGFEIDGLVCRASRGEDNVDLTKLTADLIDAKTKVGVLEAAAGQHEVQLTAATTRADGLQTQLTAAQERVTTLEAELTTAKEATREADATAAVTWLTASLTKLLAAAGKPTENLPTTVTELTAAIDAETKGLTAIIPAGGASEGARNANLSEDRPAVAVGAFKTRR